MISTSLGCPGAAFSGVCKKYTMESLKTERVNIDGLPGSKEFVLEEKDHGDLVVYDIYRKDHYLMTLARDGGILFLNFDADEEDRELFQLSHLNELIKKIQAVF